MAARYKNDIDIAKAERDFKIKNAEYDMEIQGKKAKSELSYSLQAAKTKQLIREENKQVEVIERDREIHVQEQEIIRRERELDATVRKPAEAERYRLEKIASANKSRVVLEAQAQSESIRIKGEAKAYAIQVKAKAEAEQMAKKAEAWKEYKDAALVEMMLETLPKVAEEIAQPLTKTKKVVMVSSGNSEVGASKLTEEVIDIVEKLPKVIKSMTGVDITTVCITILFL
ncbi:DgyrCDS5824 [Dimorphilus gyrociliatus]|uniref:DgyrCDS5824 n=1 Tax=Dimorphilus gyrociliatus TaxID=2664684 RepID=A0A7I8VL69_9ANNE|nr:DgyrCDS5824 [Dimorphilus gyrociliatus]